MNKRKAQLKRAVKTRAHIKRLRMDRLSVHRTSQHIYAQVISPEGKVLASASTLDKSLTDLKHGGNIEAAKAVGELIGRRAIETGCKKVAFDRSGFQYHGRIKALADAARESGVEF